MTSRQQRMIPSPAEHAWVLGAIGLLATTLTLASCGDDETQANAGELAISATIDPSPPSVGQHTLTITVDDKQGQPVLGATVTVDAQMPMHGHGSTEQPVIEELGQGRYKAFPVTFQMPGAWKVTVKALHGDQHGERAFDFEPK